MLAKELANKLLENPNAEVVISAADVNSDDPFKRIMGSDIIDIDAGEKEIVISFDGEENE